MRDICVSILMFFFPILISEFSLLFIQKGIFFFLRKLPHARNPFKKSCELLMSMANNVLLPLSVKGIKGSRGRKLGESDLPCSCDILSKFPIHTPPPCLSFLIHKIGIAAAFLLQAARRNQCFIFVFYLNTFDF